MWCFTYHKSVATNSPKSGFKVLGFKVNVLGFKVQVKVSRFTTRFDFKVPGFMAR